MSEVLSELEQLKIKKNAATVRSGLSSYLFDLSRPPSDIIANLTESDQERLKKITEEHERLVLDGTRNVPTEMSDPLMLELLQVRTPKARMKAYTFFTRKARIKEKARSEKEAKALEAAAQKVDESKKGLVPIRSFRRIGLTTQRKYYNTRLFANADFAQNLIFDMSFEYTMRLKDLRSLSRQVKDAIAVNRSFARDPFKLTFSSLTRDCNTFHQLKREFFITTGTNAFEDVDDMPYDRFDHCAIEQADEDARRNFIYLTPDSPNNLRKFDHTKTYIVGGLVDTVIVSPYTYKKARDLNIKHARLPLDKYLKWTGGRKTLSIDVLMFILLTLKQTGDFHQAFRHVPARYTRNRDDISKMLRNFHETD